MTHLYQEVSKKGLEFLNTLFSKELIITEKLDGSALICRKVNNKIQFFGREGTKRIDKITRMFNTMYEVGIEHLKKQNLSFMKNNEELHFEYFHPKVNQIVSYDHIPENGLVLLSSTSKRNLNILANDLGVLPPPIIFKGILNKEQQDELTRFLIMSPELRQIKFKTNSFSLYIISILNNNYSPVLGTNDIEGVVFGTSDGTFLSKIIDPLFTNTVMSKKDNDEVRAQYFKDISKLVTNLDISGIEEYDSSEADVEERYIDFLMNVIINNISAVLSHKDEFAKYDFGKPYIANYTDFDYNMFPKVVSDIMKDNPWFRDFARLTFNHYIKPKSRATKNFTKDDIALINNKIKLIQKYVLLDDDLDEINKVNETNETNEIGNFHTEPIGIFFGRFQPLTNGHLKAIQYMSENVDKGVVYLVKGNISSKNKLLNPFDNEMQTQLLESVLPKNIELRITNTGYYPDIINELKENNFKLFVGTDRLNDYLKMSRYINEDKNVEIIQIERDGLNEGEDISATKVREALRNDDKETFNKLTPEKIHIFYEDLRDSINNS